MSETTTEPGTPAVWRVVLVDDHAMFRSGVRHDIGSFYADPKLKKENRCDLHPRWSRDGQQVCIDSVHEHARQMYLIDVSGIVGRE